MSLSPGTRLGPYEVISRLGAGGMGEVYRARDARLGRDVAIKVLPEDLSSDAERLKRFEREARAVAALSDPHVVAVFDFGREGTTAYLVSELVEGGDLRDKIPERGMPLRQAIELASQVARGLAAAHGKGIVHRDLKPENILLTKSGEVKIADFGLAKTNEVGSGGVSQMVTAEPTATQAGAVMGTVPYMSPEQVRGESVDHRSDIFSFGAVFYEMLTGKPAFLRATAAETMTAILREDPPELTGAGRDIPVALDRIIRHCLEKNAEKRFQSASDIAFDLQFASGSSVAVGATVPARRTSRRTWLTLGAAAAALAVAIVASYRAGRKTERRAASEITYHQLSFSPQTIFQAVFAPDGETIVYSAALEGNVPELFTIRPEYPAPRPLGLPPRTHLLSISSKGEMAVLTNARYVAHRLFTGTLARVSLGGTAPREILKDVREAGWSPDGSELAIIRSVEGKDRLEFPIGKVLYETAGYLSDLRISPRGDRIALVHHPIQWSDGGALVVVSLTGKPRELSEYAFGFEGVAWSPAGDEIFVGASSAGSAQTVYGIDLSGRRRIALASAGGLTMQDVSRSGRWLVTHDEFRREIAGLGPGASTEHDLSWLDMSGHPFLSADGRRMLFDDESTSAGPDAAVCLRTTDGGPVVRLGEGDPLGLSPDGEWALAIAGTPSQIVIYPTGPGETRRLPRGKLEEIQQLYSGGWFPDGKSVIFCGNEAGKPSRCYVQDVSGGVPRPVTPDATTGCRVSPDGQQILYSKSGGNWFIERLGSGAAQAAPELTAEDRVIRWSADGHSVDVVHRDADLPFRFERVDFGSGRRKLIREVAPADRVGVMRCFGAALTEDAKSYAYGYIRLTSQLFVVQGAR